MNETVASQNLAPGLAHFLGQADAMTEFVLVLLLTLSVMSWYVILARVVRGWSRRRLSRDFLTRFGATPTRALEASKEAATEPFGRVTAAALRVWQRHAGGQRDRQEEKLTRALRRALGEESTRLEPGLPVLASVASSAPFIGLFGTVWGIYNALLAIGASGRAGLDQVAGPVGEALVMTAIGLSVAIPAVLAYNAFARGNRVLLAELDSYAHDLFDQLTDSEKAGAK